ncbi:MAG: hypothetical protein RR702_03700 [Clostridia bacterium]
MIDIIKRDYKILSKYYKYIAILIIVMGINYYRNYIDLKTDIIYNFFNVNNTCYLNILDISYAVIIKSISVFFSLLLFTYDINKNTSMIFLRINKLKWLKNKYISITILNIGLSIIYLILLYIFTLFTKVYLTSFNALEFLKIICFSNMFIYISISIYTIIENKFGIILIYLGTLLPMFSLGVRNVIAHIYGSNILNILIIYIFVSFVSYKITARKLNSCFEREC